MAIEFESNSNKCNNLLLAQYLNEIRPFFKEMTKNFIDSN